MNEITEIEALVTTLRMLDGIVDTLNLLPDSPIVDNAVKHLIIGRAMLHGLKDQLA